MARRSRATNHSGLARLESRLAALDAERQKVIDALRTAVETLTSDGTRSPVRAPVARAGRRPRFSAAARKRLSELARARWAKAKKEGRARL